MNSSAASEPFVFTPSDGAGAAAGAPTLVDQTRREIAEIVREVAAAARSDRSVEDFLSLLVDRILRAMAAQGVTVWQRHADAERIDMRCIERIGRITDQSIPTEAIGTHLRMLLEVATDGQPVVVPSTPGAHDPDVPANPVEVPVACVPIETERQLDGAEFLLEVFLEGDCGIATQRGYLRFVAQMADLAGEFLRADRIRSLQYARRLATEVDRDIAGLHEIRGAFRVEAAMVDLIAERFSFDRVGFCRGPASAVTAVSHVETLDPRSDGVQQIRRAASDPKRPAKSPDDESSADLIVREVLEPESMREFAGRIVCLQKRDATAPLDEDLRQLARFADQAGVAVRNARREPLLGQLADWLPGLSTRRRSPSLRAVTTAAILGVMGLMVVLFPIPLVVTAPATIRPDTFQTVTAPRDAIVDAVCVHHGDHVAEGDPLVRLTDPLLDEQLATLLGRRAVLEEQQTRLTAALVDMDHRRLDRLEQTQGQQRLVAEEISSIDSQLAVLREVERSLILRSAINGVVDAWQIESELPTRPLRRGQVLLHVIADNTAWKIDARVPQSRIGHVENAADAMNLTIHGALQARPDATFAASLRQIGPAIQTDPQSKSATAVLLELDRQALEQITDLPRVDYESGSPAKVMFRCGNAAAGYVLFQDLVRSIRGTVALYGSPTENRTDRSGEDA